MIAHIIANGITIATSESHCPVNACNEVFDTRYDTVTEGTVGALRVEMRDYITNNLEFVSFVAPMEVIMGSYNRGDVASIDFLFEQEDRFNG